MPPLGGKRNDLRLASEPRSRLLNRRLQRFKPHHHSRSTPIGAIIHAAVAILGKVARVPELQIHQTPCEGTPHDPIAPDDLEHLREQGDDSDAQHGSKIGFPAHLDIPFVQVYLKDVDLFDKGDQMLSLTAHDEHIIGPGFNHLGYSPKSVALL